MIGHAALNARVAPLWVAEDLGFFVKHGVKASAIFIRQAPVLVAALTAGDVHAAYTGGTRALTAVTGGADLKTIATLTNRVGYDVVAGPNIKTAMDLLRPGPLAVPCCAPVVAICGASRTGRNFLNRLSCWQSWELMLWEMQFTIF